MLGEPKNTPYDLRFKFLGIAIRIHPGFWAICVFLGFSMGMSTPPTALLVFSLAVFLSLLIHEMGHALAFNRCGIRAHVVLYHFGGLAVPTGMESYFDHASGYTSKQKLFVTAAGPGMQILAALLVIVALRAMGKTDGFLTEHVGIPARLTADPSGTLDNIIMSLSRDDLAWDLRHMDEQMQALFASADANDDQLLSLAEHDTFQTTVDSLSEQFEQTPIPVPSVTAMVIKSEHKNRFIGAELKLLEDADVGDDGLIRISDLQQTLQHQTSFESDLLNKFVYIFVMISLFWAILNLAPVYPLDGGQINRELLVLFNVHNAIPKSLLVSAATGVAIGIWGLGNNQIFLTMMFFMMAYSSYQLLQRFQRGY
ncbi:MAG: site-2 protease family protein [Planctomycetaceae bacterium]|nr:site-2 protease family protein [Planctomycetaceae bacterium]